MIYNGRVKNVKCDENHNTYQIPTVSFLHVFCHKNIIFNDQLHHQFSVVVKIYLENYMYLFNYFGYIPSHLSMVNIQIESQKNVLICFCYRIVFRCHTGHIYGIHHLLNSNLMYNIFHNLYHLK